MNNLIAVVLLVVGVTLIIWGVSSAESFSSDFSRFFTGSPTDKSMWLLIGGIVATIMGLFGLIYESRRNGSVL